MGLCPRAAQNASVAKNNDASAPVAFVAEAATGWRFDDAGLAALEHGLVRVFQPFEPAALPPDPVLAGLPFFSAVKSERPCPAEIRKNRAVHSLQEPDQDRKSTRLNSSH